MLISIDSLRLDHLGAYGYTRPTSPTIDRLAREGVVFEQAISTSSWTLPSHVSLLTSQDVSTHGVDEPHDKLSAGLPFLAEAMRAAGYATAGFYSVAMLGADYGFARGFDRYYNCTNLVKPEDHALEEFKKAFAPGSPQRKRAAFLDVSSPRIHESVAHWFGHERSEPFFLFVHYYDVHWDFIPPPPYDSMFRGLPAPATAGKRRLLRNTGYRANPSVPSIDELIALYDGEIRWTDDWIGKLMGLLQDEALLANTLVVLTSDHGEEFGEHGAMYHGNNLFDDSIRVPLIMRLPGKSRAGQRVSQQVRLIDVAPTILDIAEVEAGPDLQGTSLVPLLEGRDLALPPAHASLVKIPWHRKNVPSESLRTEGAKLIRNTETGEVLFFDLLTDRGEQAGTQIRKQGEVPAQAEALLHLLRSRDESPRNDRAHEKVDMSPEVREQLRALGYVE